MNNTGTAGKMTSTFRVGCFVCDLTYGLDGELSARWSPSVPRRLAAWEMTQYRRGPGHLARRSRQGDRRRGRCAGGSVTT